MDKLIAQGVAFFLLREGGDPGRDAAAFSCSATEYGELKRMYVRPAFRGRGFGKLMLDHLVNYRPQPGPSACCGSRPASTRLVAIAMYERAGFRRVPPFGSYTDDPVSRCYEMKID